MRRKKRVPTNKEIKTFAFNSARHKIVGFFFLFFASGLREVDLVQIWDGKPRKSWKSTIYVHLVPVVMIISSEGRR